jgi:predicted Zn-dependent protease with MMP-like domain
MKPSWARLLELATTEVETTLGELPPALQPAARALPVSYESRPSRELVADGIEPDTLGLFTGEPHAHEEDGYGGLPPKLFLFLDNLWEFAGGDEEVFLDEVHTTYLHELGHYLGLDEDDLDERGLA